MKNKVAKAGLRFFLVLSFPFIMIIGGLGLVLFSIVFHRILKE